MDTGNPPPPCTKTPSETDPCFDSPHDAMAFGRPRFDDPVSARIAREQGAVAAWRTALQSDPRGALAAVKGDFALGLSYAAGRTVLAVDRFAVQTLCWRNEGGALRFGPRADALAGAAPQLDPQALYDYLYFHTIPSPRTIFKGVHRVPPGHVAVHERGATSVEPYWRAEFQAGRNASFSDLRAEFRALLRAAVERQLDGSKPACFLSGGTDSSTVAGLIGEVAGKSAATYSIGFDAAGYDEMAYARIAARHFGTEHHEHYVTPRDLVEHIPKVAAHYDQPFGNSSALPAYLCQLAAGADGVTTLLAGDGGDELFGGNSRYAKQRLFGWYEGIAPSLRAGLFEPLLCGTPARKWPLVRKATSYVEQARVPLPDRLQMDNLMNRLGPAQVLSPSLLAQIDLEGPARQQREVWIGADASTQIDHMLAFDWRYTLAENDLRKVCGTATLAGMQVAFPLLDDDLVAFSTRLPASYKLRGLKLRWFFKEALRDFLPEEIISKRKHGFGLPFGVWVVKDQLLRRLATDSLHGLADRGIVRGAFIDELLSTHLPAHPGYYGEMVWILMMLEQWLRSHAPAARIGA